MSDTDWRRLNDQEEQPPKPTTRSSASEGPRPGMPGYQQYGTTQPNLGTCPVFPVLGPPVPIILDGSYPINIGEVLVPVWSLGPQEKRILTTYALAQGIKILAFIDALVLTINCISFAVKERPWGIFIVLFFWGPMAGYLAATWYDRYLATMFFTYFVARAAMDIFVVVRFHLWWFIVGIVCDVIIATFVGRFTWLLFKATPSELQFLRHPDYAKQVIAPRAPPFFVVF